MRKTSTAGIYSGGSNALKLFPKTLRDRVVDYYVSSRTGSIELAARTICKITKFCTCHFGERVPVTDSDTVFVLNSRRFHTSRKLQSKCILQHSRHSRNPQDNAAPNACPQGCVWHGHLDILTVVLRDTTLMVRRLPALGESGSSYPW